MKIFIFSLLAFVVGAIVGMLIVSLAVMAADKEKRERYADKNEIETGNAPK